MFQHNLFHDIFHGEPKSPHNMGKSMSRPFGPPSPHTEFGGFGHLGENQRPVFLLHHGFPDMGGSTLDFPGTMKPWGVGRLATHTVKGEKTAGHLANGILPLNNAGQLANWSAKQWKNAGYLAHHNLLPKVAGRLANCILSLKNAGLLAHHVPSLNNAGLLVNWAVKACKNAGQLAPCNSSPKVAGRLAH